MIQMADNSRETSDPKMQLFWLIHAVFGCFALAKNQTTFRDGFSVIIFCTPFIHQAVGIIKKYRNIK